MLLPASTSHVSPRSWVAQPGSQAAFLSCPIFEALIEGPRGGGKTDVLLMDYVREVGRGYGQEWRGILFRRTYPELQDVIAKTKKWFPLFFPAARYNRGSHTWVFPSGEELLLRHMRTEDDYLHYHGHAYPWIGWEELTTWPSPDCYTLMMSTSRSSVMGMPRRCRSTTNPYGKGHNWVKMRWNLPGGRMRIIREPGKPARIAIPSRLVENAALMRAEPDYLDKIRAAARNKSQLEAWIDGSWDIVAGGMFDDLWRLDVHCLPAFPLRLIPRGWRVDRSFDWGSSKPFSVGWWAESNGEPLRWNGRLYGTVRGDLIRIGEWYGWSGEPNVGLRMLAVSIADGILEREEAMGIRARVRPGPADASIFDEQNGKSIAGDMAKRSVHWEVADRSSGSRKQGWQQIRTMLDGAHPPKEHDQRRERSGLFVLDTCDQFLRTFPVASRDDRDLDDIDTEIEDHIPDEVRYRVRRQRVLATGAM